MDHFCQLIMKRVAAIMIAVGASDHEKQGEIFRYLKSGVKTQ